MTNDGNTNRLGTATVEQQALWKCVQAIIAELSILLNTRSPKDKTIADLLGISSSTMSNMKQGRKAFSKANAIELHERAKGFYEQLGHLIARERMGRSSEPDIAFWISEPIQNDHLEGYLAKQLITRIRELRKSESDDLPTLYSSPVNLQSFSRVLEEVRTAFQMEDSKLEIPDLVRGVVLKTIEPKLCEDLEKSGIIQPYWTHFMKKAKWIAEELAHTTFSEEISHDNRQWLRIGSYWEKLPPIHAFYMEGKKWQADWMHVGPWTPALATGILQPRGVRPVILSSRHEELFKLYRDSIKPPSVVGVVSRSVLRTSS